MSRVALSVLLAVAAAGCVIAPDPEPRHAAYEDVRRVVALLDDVAAEYPRTVAKGEVTSPTRMKVIDTMLHDAQLYGSRFADDERATLAEIADAVDRHANPPAIVERARTLRRGLLTGYGLVLAPAAPLDRARAIQEWDMLCAGCHGIAGMGDGPQGLGLDPEPKDFHEWAFMAELAPSRAFSQIADGVRATAMPQWGLFSTRERWGLAFLVFGFQYDTATIERGRAVATRAAIPTSLSAGADVTDRQLLEQLRGRGLDEPSAMDALAYLRGAAPFEPPIGPLAEVRLRLGELALRYPARGAEPVRLFAAARERLRDSIDAIRAASPHIAARLDRRFAELEHALATGVMDELLERDVARLGTVLDEAEHALRAPDTRGTVRLACEWALAAALALGLATNRRNATATSPAIVVVVLAASGIAAALGAHGAIYLAGLVAATFVAFTVARSRDATWPCLALAALAGAPFGSLARGLIEAHGARALFPLAVAATALASASLVARALADRWPAIATAALPVSLVIAAAGAAGRAAELASPRYLPIWRIEALGVLPSVAALAAAASAAVVAGLVMFGSRRRWCSP